MSQARAIVEDFDKAKEITEEQKEILSTLMALAETKANLFEISIQNDINDSGTKANKKLPVDAILDTQKFIHAYTAKEADHIAKAVTESLESIIESIAGAGGEWDKIAKGALSGVGKIISKGLSIFLGQGKGEETETSAYHIAVEGTALVRIDYRAWYHFVESEAISKKMEKIVVVTACKSSVDMSSVKLNAFVDEYQWIVIAEKPDLGPADVIAECKKLYNLFNELFNKQPA